MFDANLRHLPKGKIFFAKIHYCKGSVFEREGWKADDIVLAEKLDNETDNTRVRFYKEDGSFISYTDNTDFYEKLSSV